MRTAGDSEPDTAAGRSRVLPLAVVLGVALALRLAHWAAVRGAPFVAQLAMDSREYDRWAREIAGGDWLGRGVFFQAPLYPYLLALLYRFCGRNPDAAYLVQIAVGVAGCYALYRAGRALAGERVGLAAAALAAVYGPYLFYDVQLLKESLAVSVTCFLLWALVAAWLAPPEATASRCAGRWLLAGCWLGVLALLRENALLVVPFLVPLSWASGGRAPAAAARLRQAAIRAGTLLAGVVLILTPVALRNGLVGGAFLPTTFQGGVNFYIGNNPHADGTYRPIVPGKQVPELERQEPLRVAEQALGRHLDAAEVSRYWLGRGLAWAVSHPGDFLRLLWRKLGLFWSWYEWPDAVDYYQIRVLSPVFRLPLLEFGGVTLLAALGPGYLRRGRLARRFTPVLTFAGGWMVSVVVFFLFARYRLPVVPALMLLAALPVAALLQAAGDGRRDARAPALAAPGLAGTPPPEPTVGRTIALAASESAGTAILGPPIARAPGLAAPGSAGAAVLGPPVAGNRWIRVLGLVLALAAAFALPRLAGFEPRTDLVHFNLGRLAEEQGDLDLARRHYQAVLAVSPDDFLAWLDLGNLAARRRDWPEALRCYQRAAALEPDSDDAQSNLGGIYLALGQPALAAPHLARALALNPRSVQALQNSALLRLKLGDLAAARNLNRQTLEIDPANPAAQRLRARLAAMPAAPGTSPFPRPPSNSAEPRR